MPSVMPGMTNLRLNWTIGFEIELGVAPEVTETDGVSTVSVCLPSSLIEVSLLRIPR